MDNKKECPCCENKEVKKIGTCSFMGVTSILTMLCCNPECSHEWEVMSKNQNQKKVDEFV